MKSDRRVGSDTPKHLLVEHEAVKTKAIRVSLLLLCALAAHALGALLPPTVQWRKCNV